MGGDEIDGHVARSGEGEELRHPSRASRRRPADAQLRVDGFDRPGTILVELEIGLLVGLLPKTVEIGFIPCLEEPAAHLGRAVALLEMANKGVDQRVPRLRLRVRGIAVPPEDLVLRRLQRLRREPELDERLDAAGEQIVVEPVDARPVIADPAVGTLFHGAQCIVEDRVETDVPEAELVDGGLKLGLAVGAAQRARIIRTDRQIEEAVEGFRRFCDIDVDVPRGLSRSSR